MVKKAKVNSDSKTPAAAKRPTVTVDIRWVTGLLLLTIVAMLCIWKPWQDIRTPADNQGRTIKVTGQANVEAVPDEFIFSPSYTVTNPDRNQALSELARRSGTISTKLRDLGVPEDQIKSSANGYGQTIYPSAPVPDKPTGETSTYSLQLTITVTDKDLAQKVQDYLVTTSPTGAVTPNSDFSTARRRQLEAKARDDATKDARSKANQTARSLGFHLGDVKAVTDGNGFGAVPITMEGRMSATDVATAAPAAPPKIDVQPGTNTLSYSVTVEYYVR